MEYQDLSYDVIFETMLKMGPRELQNNCSVSRIHAEICNTNSFWIQKIRRDFPEIEGHYNKEKAKKAWVLCVVGRRFELQIGFWVNLNYPEKYDLLTDDEKAKFEGDEELKKYLHNLIDKKLISRIEKHYENISRYYSSIVSRNCLGLSNDMIFYIKEDVLVFYIRKRKNRKRRGIPRFREREIKLMNMFLYQNERLLGHR